MNKKKILLFAIIVILVILVVTLIVTGDSKNTLNNNENNNNSLINNVTNNLELDALSTNYLAEEESFETLTFSNIRIVEKTTDENILLANVKNNSSEKIDTQVLDFELFEENGKSIGIVGGILPEIEPNGTTTIEIPIASSVMSTFDIEVKHSGK